MNRNLMYVVRVVATMLIGTFIAGTIAAFFAIWEMIFWVFHIRILPQTTVEYLSFLAFAIVSVLLSVVLGIHFWAKTEGLLDG